MNRLTVLDSIRPYICSPGKICRDVHMHVLLPRVVVGANHPVSLPSFAEGTCFVFMSPAGTLLPFGRELFRSTSLQHLEDKIGTPKYRDAGKDCVLSLNMSF